MDLDYANKLDTAKKIFAVMAGEDYDGKEDGEEQGEQCKVEGCLPCGGQVDDGGDELSKVIKSLEILSLKGGGKGGKGGKTGKYFEGECSHCGKYGHRLRDCWVKDKEMEEYRGSKGGGKGNGGGKGKGQGGKGDSWPGKGGWKGGWSNWQKGGWQPKGKGKGKSAYSLEWNDPAGYANQSWALYSLESVGDSTKKEKETILKPPGLTGGFEVLREIDEGEEEYEANIDGDEYVENFPEIAGKVKTSKKKMPKAPEKMKNYSKGSVRSKADGEKKQCMLFQKVPSKELYPFIGPKPDRDGWIRAKGVMDSGSSASVAPPTLAPGYAITPSAGSIAGQEYLSASEDSIKNLGEQHLQMVTDDGKEGTVCYQIAEVVRPLNAVSEICDAGGEQGQLVIFGKKGGYIYNLETGATTTFDREDGIYTFEFWVKPEGFTWQG